MAKKALGKNIYEMADEEISQITEGQLIDLVEASVTAQEAGLGFDSNPRNLLHHPKLGFTVIDLPAIPKRSPAESLAYMLNPFYNRPLVIAKGGEPTTPPSKRVAMELNAKLERLKNNLPEDTNRLGMTRGILANAKSIESYQPRKTAALRSGWLKQIKIL